MAIAKVETNYTSESWTVFANALTSAQQVYANANATQEQVDAAATNLISAMNKLAEKVEVILVSVDASAYVTKLNGNKNDLTITVTERYSDGSSDVITKTFSINNNAADTYNVGGYKVYVDTKGNDQIRDCRIVEMAKAA